MKKPLTVVTAADSQFELPLAAMVCSLAKNNPEFRLFILDGGITDRPRIEQCAEGVEVTWLSPSAESIAELRVDEHVTSATYFRLLIEELLPEDLDRVLYLDSDTIINKDLSELWQTDLRGAPLGAIQDPAIVTIGTVEGIENYAALGLKGEERYFNAGVLLIDLKQFRAERISEQVLEFLKEHRPRRWDQDGT